MVHVDFFHAPHLFIELALKCSEQFVIIIETEPILIGQIRPLQPFVCQGLLNNLAACSCVVTGKLTSVSFRAPNL